MRFSGTDVSFVCVGTPARRTAIRTSTAITRIAEQIGAVLPEKATRHVIVIRSTVKPGTVEEVIQPAIEAASGLQAGAISVCASSRSSCAKARRSTTTIIRR